ncbi:hypothetical protein GALL_515980 [mine drainage metagenome]|uniref:Uncharacterized protein n=1 Tax=mine drainage metagenome TaxID=410659 RepID=A0A1J5P7V1_9ZZZZ
MRLLQKSQRNSPRVYALSCGKYPSNTRLSVINHLSGTRPASLNAAPRVVSPNTAKGQL